MYIVTPCFINFVFILIFFVLTVLLHLYDMTRYYCIFFVEYLSEDGRERPKHVGVLPHVCTPFYLIVVHIYILFLLHGTWIILNKTRSVVNLFPVTIQQNANKVCLIVYENHSYMFRPYSGHHQGLQKTKRWYTTRIKLAQVNFLFLITYVNKQYFSRQSKRSQLLVVYCGNSNLRKINFMFMVPCVAGLY